MCLNGPSLYDRHASRNMRLRYTEDGSVRGHNYTQTKIAHIGDVNFNGRSYGWIMRAIPFNVYLYYIYLERSKPVNQMPYKCVFGRETDKWLWLYGELALLENQQRHSVTNRLLNLSKQKTIYFFVCARYNRLDTLKY